MIISERSVEEIDPLKDPNAEIEITCPNCQKDFDAGYIVRNEFKIALTAERQRCEEIVLKGERRRIIEQIREERDTYWKERVRKEVEGLKFVPRIGRDKNGKIISYTSPIEEGHNNALDTLLDNLK